MAKCPKCGVETSQKRVMWMTGGEVCSGCGRIVVVMKKPKPKKK